MLFPPLVGSVRACFGRSSLAAISALLSLASASALQAGTPQTITFPEVADHVTTDAAFTLTATASSGLAVSYSITSPAGVATLTGGSITPTSTGGLVTVKAIQAGDATYDAAEPVYRTFAVIIPAQRYVKIASSSGGGHTLALRSDGTLWAWGLNENGQLGNGFTDDSHVAVQVGTDTNWASMACGFNHSLAIKTDGTLWAWGGNTYGERGDAELGITHSSPQQVGTDTTWASASAGEFHSVARRTDGTIWSWGYYLNGRLGDLSTSSRSSPGQVGIEVIWASISCGQAHTLGVRTDGTLWGWGLGTNGQLGNNSTATRTAPFRSGTISTWASVSCGNTHSLAIRTDGTMWAAGLNTSGQLGDNSITQRLSFVAISAANTWSSVAVGPTRTTAVRSDGTLWAWGSNTSGSVVGDGGSTNRTTPFQISASPTWAGAACGQYHTIGLRAAGTLYAWGDSSSGRLMQENPPTSRPEPVQAAGDAFWKSVAAGFFHTAAVRSDGTLWTWGINNNGQLGRSGAVGGGTFPPTQVGIDTSWVSVHSGWSHTFALRTDGTLWGWGANGVGQVGDGSSGNRMTPVQIGLETWTAIAPGTSHTVGIRSDGTLWAWGYNDQGQLGIGNSTTFTRDPLQIGTDTNWASVSSGQAHSLAVRTDGTLWAWGWNVRGQLGTGTTNNANAPQQVGTATSWARTAGGGTFSAALRTDGTLWTWGDNTYGQLGDRTGGSYFIPSQMGSVTTWATLNCGDSHVLATRTDGTLWGWGTNGSGQLAGYVGGSTPTQIDTATNWGSASSTVNHSAGLRSDGSLWLWGLNANGQAVRSLDMLRPFRVLPKTAVQTLTLATPTLRQGSAVTLDPVTNSGLPVRIGVVGPATLSGQTITPTAQGTVTLTLYQGGNEYWQAAPPITLTLTVAAPVPQIVITGNGVALVNGALVASAADHTAFGSVSAASGSIVRTFTITNTGGADLILGSATLGGAQAGDFMVTRAPDASVTPAGSTTLQITFDPAAPGLLTASLSLPSNDTERSPFTFAMEGTGLSQLQTWRQTHFGTAASTGSAADAADADGDGLANLTEYAFGLSPVSGASVQLPQAERSGNTFSITFTAPAGVTGVTYGASQSPSLLPESWTPVPDTGSGTIHVFSIPVGSAEKLFLQLSVTPVP